MKKIYLLLLVVVFSFSGCEKDDICDPTSTATTPRLVVQFYDNSISTPTLKNVTNLSAIADGMSNGIVFDTTLPVDDTDRYLTNGTKIFLPLQPTGTVTTYKLTFNTGAAGVENTDIITFDYTTKNVYVSRACGYKTLFNLTNTNANLVTPDSDNWIKSIFIAQPNIETENDIHVQIFF